MTAFRGTEVSLKEEKIKQKPKFLSPASEKPLVNSRRHDQISTDVYFPYTGRPLYPWT